MPSDALRRLLALVAALALLAPAFAGPAGADEPVRGADGVAPPDSVPDPVAAGEEETSPVRPFLVVPGVDLDGLGYGGTDLDADVIEQATADLPEDPTERVAEIGMRLELLPPQLDGLGEAEALLAGVLHRLDPDVAAQRGTLDVSRLHAEDAESRAVEARSRLRERTDQLAAHRRQMAEVAVAAYVRPPDADSMSSVLGGVAATNDDLTADVLFSAKTDHDDVVQDSLEVARALAVERNDQASQDAVRAGARVAAAEAALAEAEARRDAHRLALATVSGARTTIEEALPALQADMDRTIEETWGALEALAAGAGIDGAAIVSVDGIRIHAAVAPRLQALLAAARADGVPLGGWGHRSTEQQVNLRRAHCGPTPEDIFLKPAGQCSPPTARPGRSMHERGLAVDFHLAGRSISTHASPGYQWLAAHAPAFGFHNLPSEPWHWSVNGK